MKIALIFWLSIILSISSEWGGNLDASLKDAKANNKLVLLYFSGSDWCGPCIKLKKDVYENNEFQTFASKNLILVKADFPRLKKNQLSKEQTALNEKMAEKYNSKGKFPLSILLDSNGKILKEWDGYPKDLTTESISLEISSFITK